MEEFKLTEEDQRKFKKEFIDEMVSRLREIQKKKVLSGPVSFSNILDRTKVSTPEKRSENPFPYKYNTPPLSDDRSPRTPQSPRPRNKFKRGDPERRFPLPNMPIGLYEEFPLDEADIFFPGEESLLEPKSKKLEQTVKREDIVRPLILPLRLQNRKPVGSSERSAFSKKMKNLFPSRENPIPSRGGTKKRIYHKSTRLSKRKY